MKAGYDSIRGRIGCEWRRDGDRFRLKLHIPANTSATVFVPANSHDAVKEGGRPAQPRPGVKFLRQENDRAVFAVDSGEYDFESEWKN